jgi:hypothetical protein
MGSPSIGIPHDEAITDLGHGFDAECTGTDRLAHSPQARHYAIDRVIPDDSPGPASLDEIVAGEDRAASAHQSHENLHHPGLEDFPPAIDSLDRAQGGNDAKPADRKGGFVGEDDAFRQCWASC